MKRNLQSKLAWRLLKQLRKVWVRVLGYAFLAVGTVALAELLGDLLPRSWSTSISADAVDRLLSIMASSMLAVTTFSLSVAVSAFSAAARSATPRSTALLQQDPTTQNVLSTFLGAFIFSLLGLVAKSAGVYSETGLFVLFVSTALVVLLVVLAFLRWIAHLMRFGRMEDTLDRVESATADAIALRRANPLLGGACDSGEEPAQSQAIHATVTAYVQHIDMQALAQIAYDHGARLWLKAVPGSFLHRGQVLALVEGAELDEAECQRVRSAFTCEHSRTFDQDPRFGLLVLSEIASRALSPGVNDPGTAIDVIGRLARVLSHWCPEERQEEAPCPEVLLPAIEPRDLLEDAFAATIRDAGNIFEVHMRIQKALSALAQTQPDEFGEPASALARRSIAVAEKAGVHTDDLKRLRQDR